MRSLPGAPDFERLEFSMRFDPAAVRSPEGHTEALLPFSVSDPLLPNAYSTSFDVHLDKFRLAHIGYIIIII